MIDPQAVVHPSARVAPGVVIGPFSVIGPDVEIEAGCWIGPHVVIRGPTRIGMDNKIYQFASLGEDPQDRKYRDEPTELVIGDRNIIREYVTIHRGTVQDAGTTRVGDDNLIMGYAHIAHDCQVGSHTVFSNGASLAGHVRLGDHAVLGGFTLVHQFCWIGEHAFTGMGSAITQDVPPYVMVAGNPAAPHGLNLEGLRRRDFPEETITVLRKAYKLIYRQQLKLEEAIAELETLAVDCPDVQLLVEFLRRSRRGIIR